MHEQPFPVIDLEATGKNILRLRQAKGLTVRDMQGYFRFEEPRAIYKWQSGQSLPTVDNLLALSQAPGLQCRRSGSPGPWEPLFSGYLYRFLRDRGYH